MLLGMLVLKERLNGKEWASVGWPWRRWATSSALGSLPWISLFIGGTFGLTGWCASRCRWMRCPACGWKPSPCCRWSACMHPGGRPRGTACSPATTLTQGLLALSGAHGPALMLFAAATQRLNLATVGMLMYINPTLQFLTAILIFDEPCSPPACSPSG
jgi:chloramphenicol-sensitive protein RarD